MSTEAVADERGLAEFAKVKERVAPRWRAGVDQVLAERNPGLQERMDKVNARIDDLLLIPNKSKEVKKIWLDALDEYERTANLAVAYAETHLKSK